MCLDEFQVFCCREAFVFTDDAFAAKVGWFVAAAALSRDRRAAIDGVWKRLRSGASVNDHLTLGEGACAAGPPGRGLCGGSVGTCDMRALREHLSHCLGHCLGDLLGDFAASGPGTGTSTGPPKEDGHVDYLEFVGFFAAVIFTFTCSVFGAHTHIT